MIDYRATPAAIRILKNTTPNPNGTKTYAPMRLHGTAFDFIGIMPMYHIHRNDPVKLPNVYTLYPLTPEPHPELPGVLEQALAADPTPDNLTQQLIRISGSADTPAALLLLIDQHLTVNAADTTPARTRAAVTSPHLQIRWREHLRRMQEDYKDGVVQARSMLSPKALSVLVPEGRQVYLAEMATDDLLLVKDRLTALQLLAKMSGDYSDKFITMNNTTITNQQNNLNITFGDGTFVPQKLRQLDVTPALPQPQPRPPEDTEWLT